MPDAGVVLHPDIMGLRPLFEDMARRLATYGFGGVRDRAVRARGRANTARASKPAWPRRSSSTTTRSSPTSTPPRTCSSSKTTSRASGCSGSAWAATTRSRPRPPAASTPRSRSTGCCARPRAGAAPGTRPIRSTSPRRCARRSRSSASNDPYTPPEDIAALREAWKDRDDCEIIVIEGAEHGFVHDPERPIHRADDAAALWPRAIAWLRG